MRVTLRQGIVAAPTVAAAPNFLQNSAGNINIVVTSVPVVFTFAHGGANYLASEQRSVSNAWGPFVGPTVNYLYWELDDATGQIVRGATTLVPTTGSAEPVAPATGQMWFNTNNNTMYVWNGTTWKTTIRVMAGEATGSAVTAKPIGTQVGLTGNFRAGYLLRDATDRAIRVTTDPNTGAQFKFLTTETEVVSAGNDGSVIKFENSAMFARGGEVISAFSLVYTYAAPAGENTAILVGLASSDLVDFEAKAAVGIVAETLALNEVTQLITSGIVYNSAWSWTEGQIGQPLYCGSTGEVTLTKPNFAKVRCVGTVLSAKEVLLNFGWETDFDGVGPIGPQGDPGADGADGNTILSGAADPVGQGVDGDFYINTTSDTLFGPKTAGAWGVGTPLVGPQGNAGTPGTPGTPGAGGADGKTVLSGAVDPTTEGVDGDFYINTASSTLFGPKAAGVWPAGVSLVGPPGASASETANQVVYGTGAAIDSSPSFQWIESSKRLRINSAAPSTNHQVAAPDNIQIYGARNSGTGGGAGVQLFGGQGGVTEGDGGTVELRAGAANTTGVGGQIYMQGGNGAGAPFGDGGAVTLEGGGAATGTPGAVTISAGSAAEGPGGSVTITAQMGATALAADQNGGSITLTAGDRVNNGVAGNINLVIPATGTLNVNGDAGTATHVLTSNGAGVAPTWQAGGSVSETANQIVYGTGTGVGSNAQLTYIAADGTFELNPSAASATPGYVYIGGPSSNSASAVPAGDISIATGLVVGLGAATAGANIYISANRGRGTGTGGNLIFVAGDASDTGGVGGAVSITSGAGGNTGGDAGAANLVGGAILANMDGVAGSVNITGGTGGAGTGNVTGGSVVITAGAKLGTGGDGSINLVIPATGTLQINSAAGTAGHVLTSNGAGVAPTWQAGGSVSEPTNQLVFGTGTGVDSSASLTFNDTTKEFIFNGGTIASTSIQDMLFTGARSTTTGFGQYITMAAGAGGLTSGSGGAFELQGGDAVDGSGGGIRLDAGSGGGASGQGGMIRIFGGSGPTTGGGYVSITAGGTVTGAGSNVTITAGAVSGTGVGGNVALAAGIPADGGGGNVTITASDGIGINEDGGDVTITTGAKVGTGLPGTVNFVSPGGIALNGSAGTNGQVLTSGGPNAVATWTAPSASLATALWLSSTKSGVAENGYTFLWLTADKSQSTADFTVNNSSTNITVVNAGMYAMSFGVQVSPNDASGAATGGVTVRLSIVNPTGGNVDQYHYVKAGRVTTYLNVSQIMACYAADNITVSLDIIETEWSTTSATLTLVVDMKFQKLSLTLP